MPLAFRLNSLRFPSLILAVILLYACGKGSGGDTPPPPSEFRLYTIAKGSHVSVPSGIRTVRTREMKFAVRFDESARYSFEDTTFQTNINKLYGFSEGIDNQFNSARIGWAYFVDTLRLYAYVYNRGVRSWHYITHIDINKEYDCSIALSGSNYVFRVGGKQVSVARGLSEPEANGLQQFPYFGGSQPAPQEIRIWIRDL